MRIQKRKENEREKKKRKKKEKEKKKKKKKKKKQRNKVKKKSFTNLSIFFFLIYSLISQITFHFSETRRKILSTFKESAHPGRRIGRFCFFLFDSQNFLLHPAKN